MRGVFIGDLHFDRLRKLYGDKANELQAEEIEKPLDYALSKGIKTVIFGGDICEYEVMSYSAHLAFLKLILKYSKHLDIHIILGNHDFAETGLHSLQLLDLLAASKVLNCSIYTAPTKVALENVTFNFLPYPHSKPLKHFSATVNIGHFEVSGSFRDNGSKSKSDYVIKDKNLWLLGHLHTPHTIKSNIFYSGTLYQLNFGESLPKGWVDFKVKETKTGALTHDVEFVKNNPEFKLFNIDVTTLNDLDQIKKNPLYKYTLFLREGIELPENITVDYPGIVSISGYKTKKELEALKTNAMLPIEEQTLKNVSVFYGLKKNLKQQGATDQQINRALKLVKSFNQKL
jgi:DNA repair exonuclease SbcCD nuclease subunit